MDEKARSLNDLTPGTRGVIIKILGDDMYAQRLMSLSLLPGRAIQMVRLAPLGDPMLIDIGESTLSLRRREAERILVSVPPQSADGENQ